MIAKTNVAWSLPHRTKRRRQRKACPPPALRPAEHQAKAGEVILDLALCLILAATIIGLLVQAL